MSRPARGLPRVQRQETLLPAAVRLPARSTPPQFPHPSVEVYGIRGKSQLLRVWSTLRCVTATRHVTQFAPLTLLSWRGDEVSGASRALLPLQHARRSISDCSAAAGSGFEIILAINVSSWRSLENEHTALRAISRRATRSRMRDRIRNALYVRSAKTPALPGAV
jgi:hypothetical protein